MVPAENPVKVALLGTSTLELLARSVNRALQRRGLSAELYVGGFSQYQQELLSEGSSYYRFAPAYTFLLLDASDLLPSFFFEPLQQSGEEKAAAVAERAETVRRLAELNAARLPANHLFVSLLVPPPLTVLGPLNWNSSYSLHEHLLAFNLQLAKAQRELPNVWLLDLPSVALRLGYDRWIDPRMWYLARCRWGEQAMEAVASLVASSISALRGGRRKCLVLDLDNTLWGGVAGTDSLAEMQLGAEGMGLAFHEFQKVLRQLRRQGILLAINSKNNFDDSMEIIEKHPFMALRRADFAAIRINWGDKASNLREIAEELGLGLNSLVFFDDSPFERNLVRDQLPEVEVVEVPPDPVDYGKTLLSLDSFWTFFLTKEDLDRSQKYQAKVQREQKRRSAASLEDFYWRLHMKATIRPGSENLIPRISQLTQKTNQFNLTTRRYDGNQIRSFLSDPDARVFVLELSDCFGNEGVVGVAILKRQRDDFRIDTLLLSCRVIGRTIENAFVSFLAQQAKKDQASRLLGEYIPTARNSCAANLYPSLGFSPMPENGLWAFDLSGGTLPSPSWIEVMAEE